MPEQVIMHLEQLIRNFFGREDAGPNPIRWELVLDSESKGGVGIGNLIVKNKVVLAKWGWRFMIETKALWRWVIASKYSLHNKEWWPALKGGIKYSTRVRGLIPSPIARKGMQDTC